MNKKVVVSCVLGEEVANILDDYCWTRRTTRSVVLRDMLKNWADSIKEQMAENEAEGLASDEDLARAVADGLLTAKEAGLT